MYFLICSIMFHSCKVRSKDAVMIKKIMFCSCIFYTCKKAYFFGFYCITDIVFISYGFFIKNRK